MPSGSSAFEGGDKTNAPIIAQALSDQGEAALQAGDLPTAAATLKVAVARWRKLQEPASLAEALNNLAVTYVCMKQPGRAVPLLTEAAALFNTARRTARQAVALNALGAAYADMGNHKEALTHVQAALSLRRLEDDTPGELLTLGLLARVCSMSGEHLAALGYRREQLQTARGMGDRKAEAETMVHLAGTLAATGYDAEALAALQGAVDIYEPLGYLREAGETLLKLAQAHVAAGDMDAAVTPLEKGLPLLRQAGAWGPQAVQWESFLFSRRMQQQMSGAFGQWQHGEMGGLTSMIEAVRERLGTSGANLGTPVNDKLLEILANSAARLAGISPSQPQISLPFTDELAAQDTRSTLDLIAALRSPEAPDRRKAALALGVRGDLSAVEPLIEACEDRNQWVRMAAVRSLGKLEDVRALDALCKRVELDRDKEVRRSAATALGALGDRRGIEALTVALTDNYFRTVESAEKALRKLKATPDLDVFVALLTHKDAVRRYVAAERLARLGDTRAVDPLVREVGNLDQPVEARVAMLKALAALKDRRGIEAAVRVLDSTRDSSGETAARLRRAALGVIAAAGDPSGLPPLTARLVSYLDDANPYVRHAAAGALGAVGDETAIPALERIQQLDEETIQLASETGVQPRVRLRSAAAEAISRIRRRYTAGGAD